MKKKLLIILLSIIGIIIINLVNTDTNSENMEEETTSPILKKSRNMMIGFYNVENLFDIYDDPNTFDEEFTPFGKKKWDNERYQRKIEDISSVIADFSNKTNPTLMGLAEVENFDVIKDLIKSKSLFNTNYKIIHRDNNDSRGIDVAAIYDANTLNVINYNYYKIDHLHTRDILHIEGEIANSEHIHFFITHWPSRRKGTKETEHKRIEVADFLRSKIDLLLDKNPEERIIVMGDFNDEPSNKSISQHLMKNDFYNLHKTYENSKKGTVNHQGDWMVFDQIIVSKSILNGDIYDLNKNSGEIYNDNDITFTHPDGNKVPSRTYGGPKYFGGTSDHYPVYINLGIK
jgi:endonuclease/exonuclease/phosphatase family metal-dependent hydrolase